MDCRVALRLLAMTFTRVHFGKLSELSNDFVGVVGASVVYDNQFPVRVGLCQYGLYRFGDESAGIIAGHDYGY